MTRIVVAVALGCSLTAWADPPDSAKSDTVTAAATATPEASACAKSVSLMGSGCSYTTGMMAQRVLAEGKKYAYTGTLTAQPEGTRAGVAVPFSIGSQGDIHVIANEYVEALTTDGSGTNKLELSGKVLDVNGTRFFLLEGYKDLSS